MLRFEPDPEPERALDLGPELPPRDDEERALAVPRDELALRLEEPFLALDALVRLDLAGDPLFDEPCFRCPLLPEPVDLLAI